MSSGWRGATATVGDDGALRVAGDDRLALGRPRRRDGGDGLRESADDRRQVAGELRVAAHAADALRIPLEPAARRRVIAEQDADRRAASPAPRHATRCTCGGAAATVEVEHHRQLVHSGGRRRSGGRCSGAGLSRRRHPLRGAGAAAAVAAAEAEEAASAPSASAAASRPSRCDDRPWNDRGYHPAPGSARRRRSRPPRANGAPNRSGAEHGRRSQVRSQSTRRRSRRGLRSHNGGFARRVEFYGQRPRGSRRKPGRRVACPPKQSSSGRRLPGTPYQDQMGA